MFGVGGARDTTHQQTPTCTPIILDGLAVKCVMWGSVMGSCLHMLGREVLVLSGDRWSLNLKYVFCGR